MEKVNLLDTSNAISLRNIASSIESETNGYTNTSNSITIIISNIMYEKEFYSISPLNKDKLNILLNKIINKRPKALVIDLDISPDYDFSKSKQTLIDKELYSLLMQNSIDINIILPFAFFSKTQENIVLKKEWVSNMCKNGVKFGLPSLNSEMGISLQYHDYKNSMSKIASTKNNIICEDINNSLNNLYALSKNYYEEYKNSKQHPINFKNINSHTLVINEIDDLKKYDLQNKTIFLGGGYGFGDKYITPYGEKFGVQVHESIFYTISHKIDQANTLLTLIADFLLAITFGIVMEYLVNLREKLTSLNGLALNNILLFVLLITSVIISTIISALMFHNFYIWLNPIPLIIGMFLDSIIGISKRNNLNERTGTCLYYLSFGKMKNLYQDNTNNCLHYSLVSLLILTGIWSTFETVLNL